MDIPCCHPKQRSRPVWEIAPEGLDSELHCGVWGKGVVCVEGVGECATGEPVDRHVRDL